MRRLLFIFSIIIGLATTGNAQIRTSVSNLLRYGNGERSLGSLKNKFQYFENLTDVRFSLPENVTVGFRLLYDDPPEIGLPFQGISRRFIEYKKDNYSVRIGNSSELYGRGLVLNLFENRGLGYDTWVDGINAGYKNEYLKASIIAGSIEFTDSINIYRTEQYKLRGGNIEYKFNKSIKAGASFISAQAGIPQFDNSTANIKSELPEFYVDISEGAFNIFLNWANKWSTAPDLKKSSTGIGLYSAISYASGNFGLTIDYKNYTFDPQDPFLRDDETRTTKFLPFQNPPIVMKEHSYVLLSRSLHEVNFNDEVGFQIDANYTVNEDLTFSFNYSRASRLNAYEFDSDRFDFNKIERDNNFLPSTDKDLSPFMEIFGEGEYYFNESSAIRFGAAYREKTLFGDITGLDGSHIIKSTVIPIQFQHPFSNNFSAVFQYEFENVDDNFNTGQEIFYNQYISILSSIYSKYTFAIRYEFTDNKFEVSKRKDWFLTEIGYRISGTNLVTASYGRERGGQICTNGICRYIQPFKGFRLTLQTSL